MKDSRRVRGRITWVSTMLGVNSKKAISLEYYFNGKLPRPVYKILL